MGEGFKSQLTLSDFHLHLTLCSSVQFSRTVVSLDSVDFTVRESQSDHMDVLTQDLVSLRPRVRFLQAS